MVVAEKGENMRKILLLLIITLIPSISIADVSVGSFNIKNWGWNNDKDEARVAEILRRFDIIAVQEVMNDKAVENMVAILNKTTEKEGQEMSSHPVGRGGYKEQYAFIWNDNVRYDSGGTFIEIPEGIESYDEFDDGRVRNVSVVGTVTMDPGDYIRVFAQLISPTSANARDTLRAYSMNLLLF